MNTSPGELRLALWQAEGHGADVDANLEALRRTALAASSRGAELLITPEMMITGYNVGAALKQVVDHRLLPRIADIAREAGIAMVVGTGLPHPEGISNSLVLLEDDGRVLVRYDKTQLFGDLDRSLFVEGNHLGPVLSWRGFHLGFLICYDVEFPESVRALAQAGAQLVIVPTAQMHPYTFVAEHLIRVRAWENQVFVAYVNRIGREGDLEYVGRSSLAAPSGEVVAQAPARDESLLLVTIRPQQSDEGKRINPYLSDLRTDLRCLGQNSAPGADSTVSSNSTTGRSA